KLQYSCTSALTVLIAAIPSSKTTFEQVPSFVQLNKATKPTMTNKSKTATAHTATKSSFGYLSMLHKYWSSMTVITADSVLSSRRTHFDNVHEPTTATDTYQNTSMMQTPRSVPSGSVSLG